jgi:hypothetical protein
MTILYSIAAVALWGGIVFAAADGRLRIERAPVQRAAWGSV